MGNWEETIRVINKMDPLIKECSIKAQLKICEEIKRIVKRHLKLQDLNWRPLSSAYEQRKEHQGVDGGILIAYSNYYNNIEAWTKGNQHLAFVGVKKGIYTRTISGKRSHIDVATIAAAHEFATGRRLPKRPLWNPTIAEIGGTKGIKAMYVKHLVGMLRVRGIPVKQFQKIF